LLLFTQLVQMLIQIMINDKPFAWLFFLESFVAAALWPIATMLLLAPQRRAVDKDMNRPL
jgi:rod shape-determining protein MreD